MWQKILYTALKRNGWKQLFFYLSNLDISRFIELTKTVEFLNEERQELKNEIILDIGCGYSVLPSILSDKCKQYICLDLSRNACRYQGYMPNITPVIADMQHIPFKTQSVSTILAISSIEHVPNDKLVFDEISRISKKCANIFLSIPYSYKNTEIVKIKHNKLILDVLYKFEKIWKRVLGMHFNYFVEQTSTDSSMKYYNMGEIDKLIRSKNLYIKKNYIYEKWLQKKFFKIVPRGWFVIKDISLGWLLWKIEDKFMNNNTDGNGIIINMQKNG